MSRSRKRNRSPLAVERMFDRVVNRVFETEPPSVLYHYTSWAGAEGILSSQQFWATAHDCTNDHAELVSADSIIVDVARELRKQATYAAANVLDIFIREYPNQQVARVIPVYLACFSALRDDKEQWRTYGDNGRGICLGLRLLRESPPDNPGLGSGLVKVDYSEISWRSSVRTHMGQICAMLARGANPGLSLSALYRIAAFASIMAKQDKWKVEQEYRHVTIVHPGARILPKQRTSAGKKVRYLPILVRAEGKRIDFAEIVVGPNQNAKTAGERLKLLLETNGYIDPEIPRIVISGLPKWDFEGPTV